MKSTPLYPAIVLLLVLRGWFFLCAARLRDASVPSRLLRCHCSNAPEGQQLEATQMRREELPCHGASRASSRIPAEAGQNLSAAA